MPPSQRKHRAASSKSLGVSRKAAFISATREAENGDNVLDDRKAEVTVALATDQWTAQQV
jgi:hypothetical protein